MDKRIFDRSLKLHPKLEHRFYKRYKRRLGFIINHKKVYRLMKCALMLKDKYQKAAREFVKCRKVLHTQPFDVLAMDVKLVWIERD